MYSSSFLGLVKFAFASVRIKIKLLLPLCQIHENREMDYLHEIWGQHKELNNRNRQEHKTQGLASRSTEQNPILSVDGTSLSIR